MIVIDASALARYVLKGEGWVKIHELLKEEAVSVDHVLKEVANSIWRKSIVLNIEPPKIALKRFQVLKKLIDEGIVSLHNELNHLEDAFAIALDNNITVYDALYIAQAKKLNAKLITCDRKQAEVAEKLKIKVHYIP